MDKKINPLQIYCLCCWFNNNDDNNNTKNVNLAVISTWKPPPPGFVQINVAVIRIFGRIGTGAVIKDELGNIVHAGGSSLRASLHVPELKAILNGLKISVALDFVNVQVKIENESVVQAIIDQFRDDYIEESMRKMEEMAADKFANFSISATSSKENCCARTIGRYFAANHDDIPVHWRTKPQLHFAALLNAKL